MTPWILSMIAGAAAVGSTCTATPDGLSVQCMPSSQPPHVITVREARRTKDSQGLEWFLMVPVYNCGECKNREDRLSMPSIDVCRQVRDLNQGTRCVTQDDADATK